MKTEKKTCSGVILAGGLSKRFSGKNKALISIGGLTILERIYLLYKDLFDEIILVTNDPCQYIKWDFTITTDIYSVRSSLTGIHAGLFAATNPMIFVCACDTPFIKKELIRHLIDSIDPGYDVILPRTKMGVEPLCAIYSKRCVKFIEKNLEAGRFKVQGMFKKLKVLEISEKNLKTKDPGLISFFNINTPDDLKKAEELVGRQ